jgi:hypothetical protein
MSRILKVSQSDYRLQVQSGGSITLDTGSNAGTVVITGNLDVKGTTTTVESSTTTVKDNILQLNYGQSGNGISSTLGYQSGIQIGRGNYSAAQLIFDENLQFYDSQTDSTLSGAFSFKTENGQLVGIRTNSITTGGFDLSLISSGTHIVSVKGTTDYEQHVLNYTDWLTPSGLLPHSGPITLTDNPDAIPNTQALADYVESAFYYYGPHFIQEGDTKVETFDASAGRTPSRITFNVDGYEYGKFTTDGLTVGNINVKSSNIKTINTNSNLTISADGTGVINLLNKTNIKNDLHVSGVPYGTAPIVTNVIYVTMDGSDTNDGSAQDSTRACRTIGGAMKSALYNAGTSIKVSPGHYLEDNPLLVKPYTSIIGSDLRTTTIEPINKTQDLFHVQSSCYIAQMQFINGRSGIVNPNYDRGAYAVSFPTTDKIDLYKSPYIQNCTNQSGPWLFDGTMFVPNQTVQIPLAVATTSFDNNQTTITVTFTEGLSDLTAAIAINPNISINTAPQDQGFFSARTLILANESFIKEQTIAYIEQTYPSLNYQREKCRRDIGYILENILFDATFGGNSKSVEAGEFYWNGVTSVISGEQTQTNAALEYIISLITDIISNNEIDIDRLSTTGTTITGSNIITDISSDAIKQIVVGKLITGTYIPNNTVVEYVDNVNYTITISNNATDSGSTTFTTSHQIFNSNLTNGSIALYALTRNIQLIESIITSKTNIPEIFYSTGAETGLVSAEILLQKNRLFIQKEITAYIAVTYPQFTYNINTCERDVGLIVDALTQDILLGGNANCINAGLSYYEAADLLIVGEVLQTRSALDRLVTIAKLIVQNQAVSKTSGNNQTQYTNNNLERGVITATEPSIISRNIEIIKNIITNGPSSQPIKYSGSGLFSATGISADDIKQSTKVLTLTQVSGNTYTVVLDTPTVGIGTNSTLYFGYTSVYPVVESTIPSPRWDSRKVDPYGSMGGMLVDGNQITDISPIKSFVVDAYTQVNQGGRGVRVTNNGYAQLVSVFTLFSSIAIQCDRGGIASITNANANFGDYCMIAKGYGKREFKGTVYNPPELPLFPQGKFPSKNIIEIFVPDLQQRPHISLIMEVEPPAGYINNLGTSGFITSTSTISTIITGSLTIDDIDVTNMFIGQLVYLRDQFGSYSDPITGNNYITPGTIIVDIGPRTLYLSVPVNNGGGDANNPNYFNLYTVGNAYYTIISSSVAPRPNSETLTENALILPAEQKAPHLAALEKLKTLLQDIVQNNTITRLQTSIAQYKSSVNSNSTTSTRIGTLIDIVKTIVDSGISSAPTVIKTGTVTTSDGNASSLILKNIDFLVAEIYAFMSINYTFTYDITLCKRDVELISKCISDDLLAGGNYNSVNSGLSYFSRSGTHHYVTIEESTYDYNLFKHGALVNFYQRSYMSASGYLFEYVGSGSNYSALPQVGRFDPIQNREVNMLDGGKVFFTSTDQNGDFRIGTGLVISQATGVLSGRTFQKSLFAEMTPFILAIEG